MKKVLVGIVAFAILVAGAVTLTGTASANLSAPSYVAKSIKDDTNQKARYGGLGFHVSTIRCLARYKSYFCIGTIVVDSGGSYKATWNVTEAANGDLRWPGGIPVR